MIHPRASRTSVLFRLGLIVLLLFPLLAGAAGTPIARGDELSDALARQKALQAKIASQKKSVAQLNALQSQLRTTIQGTASKLDGINANLASVKADVSQMTAQVKAVQKAYTSQVAQLADLDAQLADIEAQESAKAAELAQRKALLAARIRSAYDSDRTSLLETVLSAESFSDALADVGYFVDIGAQDKALAEQIQRDQETLATLHETVAQTRTDTAQLQAETAAQKAVLDHSLADLKASKAKLAKLVAATNKQLAIQKSAYGTMSKNAAALAKTIRDEAAAVASLKTKIDKLVADQSRGGGILSQYNGTFIWPLAGAGIMVTQEFGCTGFSWEPPQGNCAHYHNGIDIATGGRQGIPIHAAAAGRVVFAGPLSDGAWVVIIAHSSNLSTWYAHVQTHIPVHVGEQVSAGQVIAYVGMTGNTTGPHLHWMAELNGTFVNPRLFL